MSKKIKHSFLMLGAVFLFATNGVAQEIPARNNEGVQRSERARETMPELYKNLSLTNDQKAKLKSLQQDNRNKMAAVRNNDQLSATEKKEKYRELQRTALKKKDSILTPDQQRVWGQERAGIKKEKPVKLEKTRDLSSGKRDENGLKKSRESNYEKLQLSQDQRKRLKDINGAYKTELVSINDNSSLSADQKKERKQTLLKQTQAKRKTLLNEDQLKQWEANSRHKKYTRLSKK